MWYNRAGERGLTEVNIVRAASGFRRWAVCAVAAAGVLMDGARAMAKDGNAVVRPAYNAGSWYPGERKALADTVDELLDQAAPVGLSGKPVAVIAPHAGYRYSAPVAAPAYRSLRGHKYRRVVVLAFSHRAASTYQGVDVSAEVSAYETPLGEVEVDREVCTALLKNRAFVSQLGLAEGEHSLELQLPFLQRTLGEFKLVPLYVGRMTPALEVEAAQALLPLLDGETLLVVSTDFTHFGKRFGYEPFTDDLPARLTELAEQAAAPLLRCDYDGFQTHLEQTRDTICGRGPVALLLRVLSMQAGAQGVRTGFDTSGKQTGDWSNSVTYQSFVFTRRPGTLQPAEQQQLLKLARDTAAAHLAHKPLPAPDTATLPEALRADGACFVTLKNHGRLRGCIGNMAAVGPLYESVTRNAVNACQDYRFASDPVTTSELKDIDVEISYLTPMVRVTDPAEIVIGEHGLEIELRGRRGVLLPQVAYERGWTRLEFLPQVCRKAGLPPNAWQDPEVKLCFFTAEVFGEKE